MLAARLLWPRRLASVARVKLPAKELLNRKKMQSESPETAITEVPLPVSQDSLPQMSPQGSQALPAALNSKIVRRYQDLCQQHPHLIVLMQVGDFYEVFGEAARRVAPLLDIALGWTDRSQRMEMTGVPVRSIEGHLERLLRAGQSVVLCDQVSTDGGRTFDRHPTRIITPGTVTEEGLLEGGRHNFILSISQRDDGGVAMAWLDLSTGMFRVASPPDPESLLLRLLPREIVIAPTATKLELVSRIQRRWPHVPIQTQTPNPNEQETETESILPEALRLCFPTAKHQATLLTELDGGELNAAALLLDYILRTQLNHRPYIEVPSRLDERGQMRIEAMALTSLDLLTAERKEASLLACIDRTVTAAGARLLSLRLRNRILLIE